MPLAASSTTRRSRMAEGSTKPMQAATNRSSRLSSRLRVPGVAASGGPARAMRPTSPMPASPESGSAPAVTIFMPVYCGGLWLAVMHAPASSPPSATAK